MCLTIVAQIVDESWCAGSDRAALLFFTVDHAERVLLETRLAVLTELGQVRTEIILQDLVVLGAAGRAADAVDAQLRLL